MSNQFQVPSVFYEITLEMSEICKNPFYSNGGKVNRLVHLKNKVRNELDNELRQRTIDTIDSIIELLG